MFTLLARLCRPQKDVHPEKTSMTLLGLDGSGKTTFLNGLLGYPQDSIRPTIGYCTSIVEFEENLIEFIDISGQPQFRDYWADFAPLAQGIVFMVDSCAPARFEEAGAALRALAPAMRGKPVLVLANKQDADGACDPAGIVAAMGLDALPEGALFKCVGVAAAALEAALPPGAPARGPTERERALKALAEFCAFLSGAPIRADAPPREPAIATALVNLACLENRVRIYKSVAMRTSSASHPAEPSTSSEVSWGPVAESQVLAGEVAGLPESSSRPSSRV